MKLSISRSISLFSGVVLIGLVVSLAASSVALRNLRIGGASYGTIIASKDLVADILPPPAYVIEAYLVANLAFRERDKLDAHVARLADLKKDYDSRRDYWRQSKDIPEDIRHELTVTSDAIVSDFWKSLDGNLLPRLRTADERGSVKALEELAGIYDRHRSIIDAVVVKANNFLASAEESAANEARIFQFFMFGSGALALVLAVAGAVLIRLSVSNPIEKLVVTIQDLAAGNLSVSVPYTDRQSEIGAMARSLEIFRTNGNDKALLEEAAARMRAASEAERDHVEAEKLARAQQQADALSRLADGLRSLARYDLSVVLQDGFAPQFLEIRQDFNDATDELRKNLLSVMHMTDSLNATATEISAASHDLARRTEEQAALIEECTASIGDLSVAISRTADASMRTKNIISDANSNLIANRTTVQETQLAIERIQAGSEKITGIVGVIDEIAFQTNFLALNAGVEAARAGAAGSGFAVVASEVLELSRRCAAAAHDIRAIISTSSTDVQQGVALVGATREAFDQIGSQISGIDGGIAAIANEALEQANKLKTVNIAVTEIDMATQRNAAMAEETNAACESLAGDCQQLAARIAQFQLAEPDQSAARAHPRSPYNLVA